MACDCTYSSISFRQVYSLSFLRNTAPSSPLMADNVLVLNLDVSMNISLERKKTVKIWAQNNGSMEMNTKFKIDEKEYNNIWEVLYL